MSETEADYRSARATRYGITGSAAYLNETLPKLAPHEQRWRPLRGGGVEMVDRQGQSQGWALVPLRRVKAAQEAAG